jgi:hypothetical protein
LGSVELKTELLCIILAAGVSGCLADRIGTGHRDNRAYSGAEARMVIELPEPDQEAISRIRDAQAWTNPYVVVYCEGYELILHGAPRQDLKLSLRSLESALLRLPIERWPLGRVVAVSEVGIGACDDNSRMPQNLERVKAMLDSHRIRADFWPA